MKPYPHHYLVEARAAATGHVDLRVDGLLPMASAPPQEFDGPRDQFPRLDKDGDGYLSGNEAPPRPIPPPGRENGEAQFPPFQ